MVILSSSTSVDDFGLIGIFAVLKYRVSSAHFVVVGNYNGLTGIDQAVFISALV